MEVSSAPPIESRTHSLSVEGESPVGADSLGVSVGPEAGKGCWKGRNGVREWAESGQKQSELGGRGRRFRLEEREL